MGRLEGCVTLCMSVVRVAQDDAHACVPASLRSCVAATLRHCVASCTSPLSFLAPLSSSHHGIQGIYVQSYGYGDIMKLECGMISFLPSILPPPSSPSAPHQTSILHSTNLILNIYYVISFYNLGSLVCL